MEQQSDDRTSIIHGIISEATREAEGIVREAEKTGQERKDAGASLAARITREAEERASAQILALKRESATRISAAKRRIGLEMRRKIYDTVIEGVTERLAAEIDLPSYKETLVGWIVEAAMGLRADIAAVNSSKPERRLLEKILPEAESEIRRLGNQSTKLLLSKEAPLPSQGIMLISQDGKTAFSNQVHTRLARYQTEIRKLVHDRLFRDAE